jgi:hypothetical protein
MPPDQGCYEERYRLTFPVARSAAFSLVALIPAIVSHQPLPWLILCPVIFVLATVPWLLAVAGRKIAFRADMAGLTLGADPLSWPFRRASAVFVPWVRCRGDRLVPEKRAVRLAHRRRPVHRHPAPPRCPGLGPRQ